MNRNVYRVIFNQARGLWMVVAENVMSQGAAASDAVKRSPTDCAAPCFAKVKSLVFGFWLALGWVASVSAQTQIVADPSAPKNQQPVLINAANGVPVVNIQTPSAAGVSRNTYSQFDVDRQGAILNNARGAAQTQLGGWVAANPMLVGGSARVILNEVNSSHPSLLHGYVEVAGDRAQVVIANPSGISCSGCGFINANRATLTTGTAVMNSGNLTGYQVQGGTVAIGSDGLDVRQTDYTDIISRSVQLDGAILGTTQSGSTPAQGPVLNVVTGVNQVSADLAQVTPSSVPAAATPSPVYAIDVAALGGMYAGKIHLLATEAGVGVRQAGELAASVGEATVNANGLLENTGVIQSASMLQLNSSGAIDNQASGKMLADQTKLSADTVTNRGLIDGQQTLLVANTLNNLGTGRLYGDQLSILAGQLNNDVETVAGQTHSGAIAARSRMDLGVGTLLNREHAEIYSAGDMVIGGALDDQLRATGKAGSINLHSASMEIGGTLTLHTGELNLVNDHFQTELLPDPNYPQYIEEYQGSGSANRYRAGTPDMYVYNAESDHLHTPEGNYENWTRYNYTRQAKIDTVTSTDPSVMRVGLDMNLTADHVVNDKSKVIVGGTLNHSGQDITNVDQVQTQVFSDAGSATSFWRQHEKGSDTTGSSSTGYRPADTVIELKWKPGTWENNAGSLAAAAQVAPLAQDMGTPRSSLYRQSPNPQAGYLIEGDPQFTNYRTWLSSDYQLQQLSVNPSSVQKRLGDGFYEQKLVREQVAQLTGRRFLEGFSSEEEQYRALMANGVSVAKEWGLRPGVSLSAQQMAQLTNDIVWMVEKDVTLADGSTTRALVPQLYAKASGAAINGSGTLIAANNVNLNLSGDLNNSGTLLAHQSATLVAQNLNNLGGQIRGGVLQLSARNDLNNVAGDIAGTGRVALQAGRDLNVSSNTRNSQSSQGSRTNVSRSGTISVSGDNAALLASAARDVNLTAAQLDNSGSNGQTTLQAGRDLNLKTVTESSQQSLAWDGANKRHEALSQEVGSSIHADGAITLQAGQDIHATAANISSEQGALQLAANRDITLQAGASRTMVDEAHQHAGKSSAFSTKTIAVRDRVDSTVAQGSTLSAEHTTLLAGQDINLVGSNAASTKQTTLQAGNNVNLLAAINQSTELHIKEERTSGLFSGGSFGVTIGTQQQNTEQTMLSHTAQGSMVGATAGSVSIAAGKRYQQTGSTVAALQGDVDIAAKQVNIVDARSTSESQTKTEFKQTGISLALTSPVLSALETAKQMKQASSQTSDKRMQVLAAATTALAGKSAYDALSTNPSQAGGINLSISLGMSKNQSLTKESHDATVGSNITASGDTHIAATGDGKDSNLILQGSDIKSGGNVTLRADNQIQLLAAQNTDEQHSTNKGSSASIGVSIGTDGLLLTLSASGSRGKANGTDKSWTNSHVSAGEQLTLTSTGDTTLRGAVASAQQVVANVGGNLNVESLQDTSKFDSKQQSIGGSISVGYGKVGGSLSFSKSSIDSDYASVTEQSGIQAGDRGFQVNVGGNTQLVGAVIASSEQAVQGGKNQFNTGGELAMSDIQNHAHYTGDSFGVTLSGSSSFDVGKPAATSSDGTAAKDAAKPGASADNKGISLALSSIGMGHDEGQASSTTRSGISGIAGNSGVRTGDGSGGINKIFDADKVQKEIDAQTQITQQFSQQAIKEVSIHTTAAYKAMFKNKAKFYAVTCTSTALACMNDPSLVSMREVTIDEAKRDGRILAVNGILNDGPRAAQLAYQNVPLDSTTNEKPPSLVLMHVAPADTTIGELMVAGYEKFLAPTFGYTNADTTYADALEGRGDDPTLSLAHSRGTIVQKNALDIAASQGYTNQHLSVVGVGGAVGYGEYAASARKVIDIKDDAVLAKQITYTYLANDPVSVIAAGNPGDALSAIREFYNVVEKNNSAHSCYGSGSTGCLTIANPVAGGPAPIKQDPSLIRVYHNGALETPGVR